MALKMNNNISFWTSEDFNFNETEIIFYCFLPSVSTRLDGLFVSTTEGWIYRFDWNGMISNELSTPVYDLVFCVDLDSPAPGKTKCQIRL